MNNKWQDINAHSIRKEKNQNKQVYISQVVD